MHCAISIQVKGSKFTNFSMWHTRIVSSLRSKRFGALAFFLAPISSKHLLRRLYCFARSRYRVYILILITRSIVVCTCFAFTGTKNGQASSCFSISAKIKRHGAISFDDCFRLACGRTSSLGGGVMGLLSSFSSSSSSLIFRLLRGLLRF